MKPYHRAISKPQFHVGKTSYFLSCDPYLAIIKNELCFTATAVSHKGITVRLTWKLTPAYAYAMSQYCSADDRDEIILSVLSDMDGAAEWDRPKVIE